MIKDLKLKAEGAKVKFELIANGEVTDIIEYEEDAKQWVEDENARQFHNPFGNRHPKITFSFNEILIAEDGTKITADNIDEYSRDENFWETMDVNANKEIERILIEGVHSKTILELFILIKRIDDREDFEGEFSKETINKIIDFLEFNTIVPLSEIVRQYHKAFNSITPGLYEIEKEQLLKHYNEKKLILAKQYAEENNKFVVGDKIKYDGSVYKIISLFFVFTSLPEMSAECVRLTAKGVEKESRGIHVNNNHLVKLV